MSTQIPTFFVQQYSTNIELLLQQKGSKLRPYVTSGSHVGKAASPVDQIGKIEAQLVTSRFSPMNRVDAPTDRRWVYPSDYDLPQLIDEFDRLRLVVDPNSQYVTNAGYALGRKMDELIIDSPVVNMEINQRGGSNLKEILDNVSRNGQQADAEAASEDGAEPIRIRIRKLVIQGVTFTESNPFEEGGPRSGTLPAIEKTNVGGSEGATPAAIGQIIIGALGGEVAKQAAKKKMTEVIEEKASGVLEGIRGGLRKE